MTRSLPEPSLRQDEPENPLICFCMKIRRQELRAAIRGGCHDLDALMEATRAGTGCATCRMDLEGLIREADTDQNGGSPPTSPWQDPNRSPHF